MTLSFLETPDFTEIVYEYFGSDVEFGEFQASLLGLAERGDVMPGCGGLRKVRWRDKRRGKGSRGGLRIIYLHVPEAAHIVLLDVYDRDETVDLSSDERRALAALAQDYRKDAIATNRRKG